MPDIHLPQIEEEDEPVAVTKAAEPHRPHRSHAWKLVLEVMLISMGVFLGLAGEQWRESAHHRELAEDALRRFRSEVAHNRAEVQRVKDYHADLQKALIEHFKPDAAHRQPFTAKVHGLEPAAFETTAWDLAIATQSLTYIDSKLAYSLAQVYNLQARYTELSKGIMQTIYLKPPVDKPEEFLQSALIYFGDVVIEEPQLLKHYDALLPELDQAVGK